MPTADPETAPRRESGYMSSAIPALLWGIAGFTACASVSQLEPSLLEDGMHLIVAQRLVRGERLYRDVFAFTGPLPFEGLLLLFPIFGEQAMAARWFISLLHGQGGLGAFSHANVVMPL